MILPYLRENHRFFNEFFVSLPLNVRLEMNLKSYIRLVFFSVILSTMVVSCYGPGYAHIGASFNYPYGYYYYPSVRVYFHYPTGYYFYLSGNTWVRTRVLPPNIHLSPLERVYLDINTNKPYLYNKEHREEYKPRPNYKSTIQQDREERIKNQKSYEKLKTYKYEEEKKYKEDKKKSKNDKRYKDRPR